MTMTQISPLGKAREDAHRVAVGTLFCVFGAYWVAAIFLALAYCTYGAYADALEQGFHLETPIQNITGMEHAIPWPSKFLLKCAGRELGNLFKLRLLIWAILTVATLTILLAFPSWYGGLQLLRATQIEDPKEAVARARRYKAIQWAYCGLELLLMLCIFVSYFVSPLMRMIPGKLLCGQAFIFFTLTTRLQMIKEVGLFISQLRTYINYRKIAAQNGKIVKKGGKGVTLKKIGEKKKELIKKFWGQVKIVTVREK